MLSLLIDEGIRWDINDCKDSGTYLLPSSSDCLVLPPSDADVLTYNACAVLINVAVAMK